MSGSRILVTGATGVLGRPLVERLLADGAAVRVMSRRARPAGDGRRCEWRVADLETGEGLDAAVAGVDVVVHCARHQRKEAVHTRRLLDAVKAAGRRPHVVYISIVGVDRVPFSYYRRKVETERLVESSGLPWTVLRATQFHDLVAAVTSAQCRLPCVCVGKGVPCQPVEVREVAARLAELAQGEPSGRVPDVAGPEVRSWYELARATMATWPRRRRIVQLRLPGKTFRAFAQGRHTAPDRAVGKVTFEEFLAAHRRG
ncbi:SDR family oxidoreductase [Streptomyces sp. WMMC1477]|uniref:SDR family oxidoreductase n=1 Tax=Streptomyces sp. WMMC1477 TaxID=3015155 RepID=UPI0022B667EA|nr:SDR family oxidoreductase [Streptomyces sp. WMMC1477]MCZ7433413.1 SDR family oxidoreductase [Streptomyces sp. WMMC1477]